MLQVGITDSAASGANLYPALFFSFFPEVKLESCGISQSGEKKRDYVVNHFVIPVVNASWI